ncbi:uncharacterized protein LOC122192173 isoform X3 [Lagopus leucura]|uniref:uncharacterized protein LOC122192173 isoform X3 n=1 Tax=Lagopus leucura TaxID=30410 RepID=UPI001C6707F3|nr:uncharacterized protein LOC122192173 isoform X3 [Lagopus leucura]XP_042748616.1 uncharacterized protein LOC122192173 isoform X3 [Lagopus leucura]XP_042748617.1 uncharacterized protein LOC122192173 isoform X3 [Lagopus leucura]
MVVHPHPQRTMGPVQFTGSCKTSSEPSPGGGSSTTTAPAAAALSTSSTKTRAASKSSNCGIAMVSQEHGGAEREWLRNGAGTQGSHRCCVTTFLSGPCKLLLPSPASGAMLKLEESFPWLVGKMAQLQVLCPSLFLESNLLESRRAAGCLLCGCCGHFSQLRSLSPCWQRMCCATISSVEPLCSFSALAAVVPVSRCHKPDWHSLGTQTWETVKKAKASAALLRKEAKKESKKNQEGLEREGPQDTRISWNASSEVAPKAAD